MEQVFLSMLDSTGRIASVHEGGYKRLKLYGYDSGNIKYVCQNVDVDAVETDETWDIIKLTDEDLPSKEGPRLGAVNTEGVVDALSWNI